jgi:hypothetical protein
MAENSIDPRQILLETRPPEIIPEVAALATPVQAQILIVLSEQNRRIDSQFAELKRDSDVKHAENVGRFSRLEARQEHTNGSITELRADDIRHGERIAATRDNVALLFKKLEGVTKTDAFRLGMVEGIKKVSTWVWLTGAAGVGFVLDHLGVILQWFSHK